MNVRHNRLRVRQKPAVSHFPLPPLIAIGMAAGYVIGCCFGANAALPEPSNPVLSFFEQQRRGRDAVRRHAARTVRLVRLWFCVFAAVYILSWLFADSGRFWRQRLSVRVYGGGLPEFWLRSCVLALVHCGRAARCFSRAGAVSARHALRADVCASARAAARPASPCDIGAVFPGAGARVLPAAGGCGRRVLCGTVLHTAYSVTRGHCG